MHEILLIVAPVAGLVLLGFVAAKLNYLPEAAIAGLPAIAFKVTMPALIFRAFLSVDELRSAPEAMIYVYVGTVAIIWVLVSLLTVALLRRPAADAAPISMATCFSNSVMLGLPLSLSAFGPQSTIPAAIIIAIDTPLMWLVAVTQIELALPGGRRFSLAALRPVIIRLFTNPIILATLAGVSGRLAELELSRAPERFIDLLAGAAVPVALFAMGMTLSTFSLRWSDTDTMRYDGLQASADADDRSSSGALCMATTAGLVCYSRVVCSIAGWCEPVLICSAVRACPRNTFGIDCRHNYAFAGNSLCHTLFNKKRLPDFWLEQDRSEWSHRSTCPL